VITVEPGQGPVTVLEVVAELPQPSTAVNILVCEDEQLDVTIARISKC
jgi:hypothetical protein